MIKLVIVRHGQSMWNLENKFTGWTDVPLSEKGIEEAKKQGKYKGRQPIKVDSEQFKRIYFRWKNDEITARQAMQELGLKPDTFYRRVKAYEKGIGTTE